MGAALFHLGGSLFQISGGGGSDRVDRGPPCILAVLAGHQERIFIWLPIPCSTAEK
jgi:hypothetical protein